MTAPPDSAVIVSRAAPSLSQTYVLLMLMHLNLDYRDRRQGGTRWRGVGIDLGMNGFAIFSTGKKIETSGLYSGAAGRKILKPSQSRLRRPAAGTVQSLVRMPVPGSHRV